jgi:hypothetical protein
MNDRAVSTTLGYALTLSITTILISGLLIAAGGYVQDQRERTIRTEMEVIGQQLAADVQAADRFVQAGDSDFTVRRDLPDKVAGSSYTVTIVVDNPQETYVRLKSTDPTVIVEVDMALQTNIGESSFTGGSFAVTYDTGTGQLEVEDE